MCWSIRQGMGRLPDLFSDLLQRPNHYLGTTKGADFEDRIDAKLHSLGYSRIIKDDISQNVLFDKFKKCVLEKAEVRPLANPFLHNFSRHFLYQPYGSQEYPDFLVLDNNFAVCIEVKFSKNKSGKPIWNSGLPRPNGIYIFGSHGRKDITFFRGAEVVSVLEAKKLHGFFRQMKEHEMDFNTCQMQYQPYGYSAYIRKAFDQSRKYNQESELDFFSNPKRLELEKAAIGFLPRQKTAY